MSIDTVIQWFQLTVLLPMMVALILFKRFNRFRFLGWIALLISQILTLNIWDINYEITAVGVLVEIVFILILLTIIATEWARR
ncbi:hypothetical protein [Rhodomicrobium vannielii]|uniref:hypothetical protein n=1 Tax=Rhodomicrobium vannielii TaxID=1069 RepID=UPI000B4BFE11|nr:hypothetical protein [Rhodomicrobium vannielii]